MILEKNSQFFRKILFFEKFPKIPIFHRRQYFYVFCAPKTLINQISCIGEISRGLWWNFLTYWPNFWRKMFKNVTFWPKSAQYLDFDTPYGFQTNFNGLSTWKHIEIEYQILFVAFSEAEIFFIRFEGRNRAFTGEIGPDIHIFWPETKNFFDPLFQ